MPDRRFHAAKGPFRLGALAEIAMARLGPGADADRRIDDVAPLETAGANDISFLDNPRYLAAFGRSGAGACVVAPAHASQAPARMALLLSEAPYLAYARIARTFYPDEQVSAEVAPSAVVAPDARLGADCSIAAGAVIGAGASLGAGTCIGPGAYIGTHVVLGEHCRIGAHASISHALIGARVIVHAGARLGQEGFGFAATDTGLVKVPQLGRIIVEDDVEIGANTTIDRGSGPDTVIGAGCKIDNLVQIGHNVRLGRGCVIVAQVGISGSTVLGDGVVLGGQVGVAGHLSIGTNVRAAAKSGITRSIPAGQTIGGMPAVPVHQWRRQVATLTRLAKSRGKS